MPEEGPEVLSASGKGLHPYHQRDTSNEDEDWAEAGSTSRLWADEHTKHDLSIIESYTTIKDEIRAFHSDQLIGFILNQ